MKTVEGLLFFFLPPCLVTPAEKKSVTQKIKLVWPYDLRIVDGSPLGACRNNNTINSGLMTVDIVSLCTSAPIGVASV